MKIEEKKRFVDELKDNLEKTKVFIVADYKGLNVAAMTDLRRKLSDADVECKVVKNTLLRRAIEQTEFDLIKDILVGPNAIILSYDDPVAPAKVLMDFAKNNKNLEVKKGIMAGKILEEKDIKALSDLPSREVLLSQVLSVLNGVPTSIVRVMAAVPQNMLNVLQAIKDQKEAA